MNTQNNRVLAHKWLHQENVPACRCFQESNQRVTDFCTIVIKIPHLSSNVSSTNEVHIFILQVVLEYLTKNRVSSCLCGSIRHLQYSY